MRSAVGRLPGLVARNVVRALNTPVTNRVAATTASSASSFSRPDVGLQHPANGVPVAVAHTSARRRGDSAVGFPVLRGETSASAAAIQAARKSVRGELFLEGRRVVEENNAAEYRQACDEILKANYKITLSQGVVIKGSVEEIYKKVHEMRFNDLSSMEAHEQLYQLLLSIIKKVIELSNEHQIFLDRDNNLAYSNVEYVGAKISSVARLSTVRGGAGICHNNDINIGEETAFLELVLKNLIDGKPPLDKNFLTSYRAWLSKEGSSRFKVYSALVYPEMAGEVTQEMWRGREKNVNSPFSLLVTQGSLRPIPTGEGFAAPPPVDTEGERRRFGIVSPWFTDGLQLASQQEATSQAALTLPEGLLVDAAGEPGVVNAPGVVVFGK